MGDRALDARLVPLVPTDNETIGINSPDPMSIVNYTYLMQRDDRTPNQKSTLKCTVVPRKPTKFDKYLDKDLKPKGVSCSHCQYVLVTIKYEVQSRIPIVTLTCPCCCVPCRKDDDCSKCVGMHTTDECYHAERSGKGFLVGRKWKDYHSDWDTILRYKDGTPHKNTNDYDICEKCGTNRNVEYDVSGTYLCTKCDFRWLSRTITGGRK